MSSASHSWSPITDLSAEDRAAASDELPALVATWQEQRELMDPRQVERFNERLARQWAIETGIIERIYTLDRGTTQLLIERGIDSSLIPYGDSDQSPELVAGIISDQQSAVDWLFDAVKQERPLTTSFVKELHALMTRRQEHVDGIDQFGKPTKAPLLHGQYKQTPNNPSKPGGVEHEYCPPVHVAAEMDRLVELHEQHAVEGVPPEVEAAWLHHRFTQIHPFQDGNGRVARALASLVLIQAGWFPLVVTRDDRTRYLDALEAADTGNLAPLVGLVASLERRSMLNALTISDEILPSPRQVDQMIDAIADRLAERTSAAQALDQAQETASRLVEVAESRFREVRDQLTARVSSDESLDISIFSDVDVAWSDQRRAREGAHAAGEATNEAFSAWVSLSVATTTGEATVWVFFLATGSDYRGLIRISGLFTPDVGAEFEVLVDDPFQINYVEDPASVERRFRPWLEEVILLGLDAWRRTL